MVEAVATWVANTAAAIAADAGASAAVASAVHAVAYYGTQVAITVGVNAALQAMVSTPDIDSAKASKKQAVPPRVRGYGRRKLGGYLALWEAVGNKAFDVVYICEGPIEAIQQVWTFDHVMTVNPDGWVQSSPEYGAGASDLIHLESRLGATPEANYPAMTAALPEVWPSNARGDGCVSLGIDYRHAKKENLTADYKSGDPSSAWAITGLLSRVWDPRIAGQERLSPFKPGFVQTASQNLALQIMDLCLHATGMAMDYETEIAPHLDHWKGEADICDEWIDRADGTQERRYWGSGYYAIPDDPQNALDKMLAACDGVLLKDENGAYRLWVGKYRAPTVHLTDEDLGDYDLEADAEAFDAVNELIPKYVDEASNWGLVDATGWRDEAAIARAGRVISDALSLEWANSVSVARRVTKAKLRRLQTPLRVAWAGNMASARAMGHRWIKADIADLQMEGQVFEMLTAGRFAFARGGVDLSLALADVTAYDWDAATEEQAGELIDRPPVVALDPPTITSVSPFPESLGGAEGIRLMVNGAGPDREDLTWFVQWRVLGATSYAPAEVTDEAAGPPFSGATGFVSGDAQLEVQLGYQTARSAIQWSDVVIVGPFTITPVLTETGDELLSETGARILAE